MPVDPEDMKNAWTLPPIDWSMHHPDEEPEPFDMPPFPPYSYDRIRRALEDGEYEIVSVEVERPSE